MCPGFRRRETPNEHGTLSADARDSKALRSDVSFELVLWLPKGNQVNPPRRTYPPQERDDRVIWSKWRINLEFPNHPGQLSAHDTVSLSPNFIGSASSISSQ